MQILPSAEFEGYLADALDALPPDVLASLSNAVVVVEDENPTDPDVLGLYEGIALTDRGDYSGVLPDRISIYRLPLCLLAEDVDDLIAEIAITVVHEFGHHVGLTEDRLHELGWG